MNRGSSVGKKILMSLSGLVMLLFLTVHVVGNATLFFGNLNAYAAKLHSMPALIWLIRAVMSAMFALHVILAIQLTLENRAAKPDRYALNRSLSTTFAGKNMIWTGLVIGAFLVYHLVHFTIRTANPGISAKLVNDSLGRPDVTAMVITSFSMTAVALIYVLAMTALVLHLTHGIQSSFQTLGLAGTKSLPKIIKAGAVCAFLIFIGYISVPVLIFTGLVQGQVLQ